MDEKVEFMGAGGKGRSTGQETRVLVRRALRGEGVARAASNREREGDKPFLGLVEDLR